MRRCSYCPACCCEWRCCTIWVYFLSAPLIGRVYWTPICRLIPCELPPSCDTSIQSNVTGLKVILASVGQTGTSSVTQALRDAGMKVYHAEEKYAFLWDAMQDGATEDTIALSTARCKVDVVSLEPSTEMFPAFIARSPGAKVILTYRSFPGWYKSTTSNGVVKDLSWGLLLQLPRYAGDFFPWGFLLDAATGVFTRFLAEGPMFCGIGQLSVLAYYAKVNLANQRYVGRLGAVYTRGVFKVDAGEEAYLAHMNEIRALTPPDQLLEFDIKAGHGWTELEQFLGVKRPDGSAEFPHPRSAASWTNDATFDHNKPAARASIALMLLQHVANYFLFISTLWLLGFPRRWIRRTFFR